MEQYIAHVVTGSVAVIGTMLAYKQVIRKALADQAIAHEQAATARETAVVQAAAAREAAAVQAAAAKAAAEAQAHATEKVSEDTLAAKVMGDMLVRLREVESDNRGLHSSKHQLQSEMQAMQSKHDLDIIDMRQAHQREMDELRHRHAEEMAALEAQMRAMQTRHEEEMRSIQEKHRIEMEVLLESIKKESNGQKGEGE